MAESISYLPFTFSPSRRLFCIFAPKGDGIIRLSLIWLAIVASGLALVLFGVA